MAAIAGTMFFMGVLAFAGWVIVESLRPRLGRILFLLQYGPVIDAPLPGPTRVTMRGRAVPFRVSMPPRLRAAAA